MTRREFIFIEWRSSGCAQVVERAQQLRLELGVTCFKLRVQLQTALGNIGLAQAFVSEYDGFRFAGWVGD